MSTLILITSHFPYGSGESFIVAEMKRLAGNFSKIIIIAQDISGEMTRIIPPNAIVYRYNPSSSFSELLYLPILFILNAGRIVKLIEEEVIFRRSITNRLNIVKLFHLFKRIIKAIQLKNFIKEILLDEGINENIVFYSYWLKAGAQAIAMLNYKGSIKIARAHGSDLYEEVNKSSYLPLLKFTADNLNAIFFISNHGKSYFINKTRQDSTNFIVSYLGIEIDDFTNNTSEDTNKYVIVSCSNLIPIKRIGLIIKSLELVQTAKTISWLHFGDGILRKQLEESAKRQLGNKSMVEYRFMGNYPNLELLRYYNNNQIDLFINTSSTEGVPVSIMEAQSYGIPVIATDVGGVKELVTQGTGSLLQVDFKPEELAKMIQSYSNLREEEEIKIRMNAFNNCQHNFNASVNYQNFIIKVNSILASANK